MLFARFNACQLFAHFNSCECIRTKSRDFPQMRMGKRQRLEIHECLIIISCPFRQSGKALARMNSWQSGKALARMNSYFGEICGLGCARFVVHSNDVMIGAAAKSPPRVSNDGSCPYSSTKLNYQYNGISRIQRRLLPWLETAPTGA